MLVDVIFPKFSILFYYFYIYSDKNYFVSRQLTDYSFAKAAHQGT